jgi:hypothetical protein
MTSPATGPYVGACPPDELRELLGEGGAFECHQRGVRDVGAPATRDAVAEVLAGIYGADPMVLVNSTVASECLKVTHGFNGRDYTH